MGRITDDQRKIIESFSCERLSCKQENRELIKNFRNERGQPLVDYLQKFAWDEDMSGKVAHYLIKNEDGEVVLFFSLKCGALFKTLDEETIKRQGELLKTIIQTINKDGQERDVALQLLECFRVGQDISLEQIKQGIKTNTQQIQRFLNQLSYDKEHETNDQIIRVLDTYPGIDLVNFCSNDLAKEKWGDSGLKRPMGEVMFWSYIAPIMYKTQECIGCQYIFLFAADTSEDGTLINYYNVALKFEQPTDIGTNKPRYDLCCQFMCQEISKLRQNREEYFNNFNPADDDIIA